jgi:hypothetical protein
MTAAPAERRIGIAAQVEERPRRCREEEPVDRGDVFGGQPSRLDDPADGRALVAAPGQEDFDRRRLAVAVPLLSPGGSA